MWSLAKCSHPAPKTDASIAVTKSGGDTLDIGIEISPLSYSLAGDSVCGLDYELIDSIMTRNGRPYKLHPFAPVDYALAKLREGTFDIVVGSLVSTSTLKQDFLLTRDVYLDREVLVQRRGDSAFRNGAEELAGDTVWLAAGSPFVQRLANLAVELGDTIYIEQPAGRTAEHLVMMVAKGVIPRAVVNEGVAKRMATRYDNIDFSTPVSFTQFQVWALAGDNTALRDSLDAWITRFMDTPGYCSVTDKYLQ